MEAPDLEITIRPETSHLDATLDRLGHSIRSLRVTAIRWKWLGLTSHQTLERWL